jgi:hypothetical protein
MDQCADESMLKLYNAQMSQCADESMLKLYNARMSQFANDHARAQTDVY